MKNITIILTALCFAVTGCKTVKKVAGSDASYITVGVVMTAADRAMSNWARFVVHEESRIADIQDAGVRLDQRSVLLKREGKVQNAYGIYQKALGSAKVALKDALKDPSQAEAPSELTAALSTLVNTATP